MASASVDLGATLLQGGGSPGGAAGGDLSGTYPNPGVATVGGSSAANIHTSQLLTAAATSASTVSTLAKRDANGNANFAALTMSTTQVSVPGTSALSWSGGGPVTAQAVIGTEGTVGASLYVTTPSLNGNFSSGLGVDGTYVAQLSTIKLHALGVQSSGGYASQLAIYTTVEGLENLALTVKSDTTTESTGGVILNTAGSKPAAGVAYRGMLFVVQGGGGVADKLQVCLKAAGGTYSWVDIVSG